MTFESIQLEADEKIIQIVHRHWLTLAIQLFSLAVFAFVPLVVFGILAVANTSLPLLPIDVTDYARYFVFGYLAWLLCLHMALGRTFINHYLDVWAITNRRVITIDQIGFFRRQTGSFRLERIQDVNVSVNGIIATLLDYGTLEVETASGGGEEFRAHLMPHPQTIKATILAAADQLNHSNPVASPELHI